MMMINLFLFLAEFDFIGIYFSKIPKNEIPSRSINTHIRLSSYYTYNMVLSMLMNVNKKNNFLIMSVMDQLGE